MVERFSKRYFIVKLTLVCFNILFSLCLSAENKEDITVKRERTFIGTSLYGFMNGGADLFLEYGVKQLVTRDLVYIEEDYTLDIYEMSSPEDAFGIYSVHVFKCTQADTDDDINCLSTFQLQTITGNFYISLVFPSGSEKARTHAKELLNRYMADIKGDKIAFSEQIKTTVSSPYTGSLKFLRGPISISKEQFSLAPLLKDSCIIGVWLFPSDREDENRAIILFNDTETANVIREKIEKDDIVDSAASWLHIRCRETMKPTDNYGPFGF